MPPFLCSFSSDLSDHAYIAAFSNFLVLHCICNLHAHSYWTAFWVFAGGNLALLLLASSITAFVSPAAGGSGIPEVKAYLNGVDAPNIFSLRTLAVKVRRRRACS